MIITRKNSIANQIVSYALVGGLAAIADLLVTSLVAEIFELHYLVAVSAGFVVGSSINYFLAVKFVFKSAKKTQLEFILYILIGLAGLLFTQAIVFTLITFLHRDLITSKVIAIGTVFVWNFSARRMLTVLKS